MREELLDFAMPRHGLTHLGLRVLIPVVFPTVPDEHAALRLELANEIEPLHATASSARRRTWGIFPLVTSS